MRSSVHVDLLGPLAELLQHLGQLLVLPHFEVLGGGDPHPLELLGDAPSVGHSVDDVVGGVQRVPPGSTRGGERHGGVGAGVEAPGVAALHAPSVLLPQGLDPVELGGVLVELLTIREIN